MSHAASKNLLFTINDLLVSLSFHHYFRQRLTLSSIFKDLTRLETGKAIAIRDPFDLPALLVDAVSGFKAEAERRSIAFTLNTTGLPQFVVGDSKKLRQVVANLTANAGMSLLGLIDLL